MQHKFETMKAVNNPDLNNWVNHNKALLSQYKGEWIAYNEKGLIAHDETLATLCNKAKEIDNDFLVYFVDPYQFGTVRFRAVHFRAVSFQEWTPFIPIKLSFGQNSVDLPMLVDSGADASLISTDMGKQLNLQLAEGETIQEARGIGGGKIGFVWRNLQITIDNQTITAPVAWIVEGENQENILGRQVVFDEFDIEFKQADEQIIFRKRS